MTPALASLERYRENALTRWLEATFGDLTGFVILGALLALIALIYYLHTKAIAAPDAAKDREHD